MEKKLFSPVADGFREKEESFLWGWREWMKRTAGSMQVLTLQKLVFLGGSGR